MFGNKVHVLLVFALVASGVLADFLDNVPADRDPEATDTNVYLAPNEFNPKDATPILNSLSPGVYLSVGTERGFMAAALGKNISHLLLTDRNPLVVQYNRINILLLKLFNERERYVAWRTRARSYDEWTALVKGSNLSTEEKLWLGKDSVWQFWQRNAVQHTKMTSFHTPPSGESLPFHRANYLFDDTLFQRLHEMANRGNLQAVRVQLEDAAEVTMVAKALSDKRLKLAAVDISNGWQDQYLGERGIFLMLQALGESVAEESVLITTQVTPRFVEVPDYRWRWTYAKKSIRYLRDPADILSYQIFLQALQDVSCEVMLNRLLEANNSGSLDASSLIFGR